MNKGTIKQKRKPGKERRLEIARISAELFAARGFSVSTRSISDALGITQAALYKHFSSKDALIEEVFRVCYLDDKPSRFSALLVEQGHSLPQRLTNAYTDFFEQITATSLKLFQRASYDGLEIAKRYSPHLDARILMPVLDELRSEAGLPAVSQVAAGKDERELVLMLHSAIVFLAIRKFVYNINFDGREAHIIELNVTTWLGGARQLINSVHARTE